MTDPNSTPSPSSTPTSEQLSAAGALDRLSEQLERTGAGGAAARLADAAARLRAGNRDVGDLEQRIDPERVIDERRAACGRILRKENSQDPRGFFSRLLGLRRSVLLAQIVRNSFALLPLIFTWGSLGLAVRKYEDSRSTEALLLFWQNGHVLIPFQWVAFIDVGFLVVVVLSTWWVHGTENSADAFTASLYDAMGKVEEATGASGVGKVDSPVALIRSVDQSLRGAITATQQLTEEARRSINASTAAMEAGSAAIATVGKQLKDVQDQNQRFLDTLQAKNAEFLQNFKDDAQKVINNFGQQFLESLNQVHEQNKQSAKELAAENRAAVEKLTQDVVVPMTIKVRDLMTDLAAQQDASRAATRDLTQAVAGNLTQAVAAIKEPADLLAAEAAKFASSTRTVDNSLAKMATEQQRLASQVESSAQGIRAAGTAMSAASASLQAVQAGMMEGGRQMAANVTQASASLRTTQDGLAAATRALLESAEVFAAAIGRQAPGGVDAQRGFEIVAAAIREAGLGGRPRRWRLLPFPHRSDGFGGKSDGFGGK